MADINFVKVGGRMHSTSEDSNPANNHVTSGANEIYDDAKGKKQNVINQETDEALADRYTKDQTYNKAELNNMITTPNQQYVTVATYSALPASGSADTVYRVSNWDGTQVDETCYSEYAWNGSAYVHLSTKTQIGEVFDISAYHATGGTLATYADLSAALDSNNGGGVPQSLQEGGMRVQFVQSSDNKYVQARCMAQNFTTDVTQWQGVDEEPIDGSKNLVESEGISLALKRGLAPKAEAKNGPVSSDLDVADEYGNIVMRLSGGHIRTKGFDSSTINDFFSHVQNGDYDLSIEDERGNTLALFHDGHFQTKKFSSKNNIIVDNKKIEADLIIQDSHENVIAVYKNGIHITKYPSPYTKNEKNFDFDITDDKGNILFAIQDGYPISKNFNGKNVFDKIEDIIENNLNYILTEIPGVDIALSAQKYTDGSNRAGNNYSKFTTLLHLTDIHTDVEAFKRAIKLGEILNVDCICNTGDSVDYSSKDDTSYIEKNINKNKYVEALGNHDVWHFPSDKTAYEKYYKFIKDYVTLDSNVEYPTWGYKDLDEKKLRIIFLNQWESDGTTYHYYFNYSQNQIDFLVSTLINTPIEYGIVLMYHSPEKGSYVATPNYDKFFMNGISYNTGQFMSQTPIKDILDAFISRTSISNVYTKNNGNTFTVNADFGNVDQSVEFIMCLCGHMHADLINYIPNCNNIILQCDEVCTNSWVSRNRSTGEYDPSARGYNEINDLGRQNGTVVENAFNVYVIDRMRGLVKIIRIGSQISTFDLSRRDCMVIPYK